MNTFLYLGIVFSTGGSFSECHKTFAGQALKAIFKLYRYLYNFTKITPRHKLEIFDKLVTPILNYGSEKWGFSQAKQIERIHMLFCKQLLGVKQVLKTILFMGSLAYNLLNEKHMYYYQILVKSCACRRQEVYKSNL